MKKLSALLLVIVFALTLLCACNNNTDNSSQSQSSSNQEQSSLEEQSSSNQEQNSSSVAPTILSVGFDVSSVRKVYAVGEELDLAPSLIYAEMSNGSYDKKEVSDCTLTTQFNSQQTGEYTVKVAYDSQNFVEFTAFVLTAPEVKETYEITVDGSFSGAIAELDGNSRPQFKTMSLAIDYLKLLPKTAQKNVYIKAGSYKEKLYFGEELENVCLIGEGAETTKLTYDDWAGVKRVDGTTLNTDGSSSVYVYGDGFSAKNIWFENSFDYFSQNANQKQGLAILIDADKCVFENCVFTGYQDTVETARGRHYFKNCTIKGCVDFIFGYNPTSLFENCSIVTVNRNESNGGYITATFGNDGTNGSGVATYGYVFMGCSLTAEQGVQNNSVSLGRPWRADSTVAWINCDMGSHIAVNGYGKGRARYNSMSGGGMENYPFNAYYAEYGNTGAGATQETLYSTIAVKEGNQYVTKVMDIPDFKHLTDQEVALYTLENIFAKVNGQVTYETNFDAASALLVLQAR